MKFPIASLTATGPKAVISLSFQLNAGGSLPGKCIFIIYWRWLEHKISISKGSQWLHTELAWRISQLLKQPSVSNTHSYRWFWPIDAYMHHWTGSLVVQVMTWHLFNNKRLQCNQCWHVVIPNGPLGTNLSEICNKTYQFSFNKVHLKMLSVKCQSFWWPVSCNGSWQIRSTFMYDPALVVLTQNICTKSH